MENVFLKLLNMSITAGWLVLVVVILRILLKNAPKSIRCFLWALVAFRLICPFSFESVLSLIPSTETVPENIMYVQEPTLQTGITVINNVVNPVITENFTPVAENSVNPMRVVTQVASVVWMLGVLIMAIYAVFSYLRIHRKVAASVNLEDNLYICDYIDTPFILGMIKPRIYIPSTLEAEQAAYVVAHEKAHLKRLDHWWKPLGFALLSVYWFNPLIWLAYILLCRDIELACDERVIKELGESEKKSYSETLLLCSIPRKMIVACPLAFGEVGVKERVKTVLNYKKPAFWIMAVAVVACIVVAVCFLTNPKEDVQGETQQTEEQDSQGGAEQTEEQDPQDESQQIEEQSSQGSEADTTDTGFVGAEPLTMERLIELCESGREALAADMSSFVRGDGLPYSNFEKGKIHEGTLNWDYFCNLSYEGEEYRLQVSYWNPETAEQYGHVADELSDIYLTHIASGDMQLLYTTEERFTANSDIRSFLDKEYDMGTHLTLELPEGLQLGAYQVDLLAPWQGSIFEGDYEEMPHGEGTLEAWYAPGGVGFTKWDERNSSQGPVFENGKLQSFDWSDMNHAWRESEFEVVEGCDMQAVICEYNFDLFTAAEGQEYWEANGLTEEEFQSLATSKYWYIFFAEPNNEYQYTLFLNQQYFSREDAIAMAKTVKFAE